jgi:diacylglycerol O-acyltransferase
VLQLDATDTMFIEQESLGPPQHVSPVLIYDPAVTPFGHMHYREIVETFKHNLHKSDIFRRRLLRAPMNLDRPYWMEDDNFDLNYHMRHIALPKPGNWDQLRKLLARLHAVPLDMSRPLWEAYVIEGLDNLAGHQPGSFALLLKIHHSTASEEGITQLIGGLHQGAANTAEQPPHDYNWHPAPAPKALHMLSRAYINGFRRPSTLIKAVAHIRPGAGKRFVSSNNKAEDSPHDAAVTRFNAHITPERVTDFVAVEHQVLVDVTRRVKEAHAALEPTLYEVLLSVIGGALRQYLGDKNELPGASLTAAIPAIGCPGPIGATAHPAIERELTLGTHIADPVQRLITIHAAHAAQATRKTSKAARSERHPAKVTTSLWPSPWLEEHTPSPHIISSLTPRQPAYLAGARLSSAMAMPAIVDQIGLNHSVLHHGTHIALMFVACPTMLPDPEFYTQCLEHNLQLLKDAARQLAS